MAVRSLFLLPCVVAAIGPLSGCRSEACSNELVATYPSPGNELSAIVFVRQCEKAGTSTQLSILPAGSTLRNEEANVFVATSQAATPPAGAGHPVTVEWFGRNRLRITYDRRARILKQARSEAAVVIQYVRGP